MSDLPPALHATISKDIDALRLAYDSIAEGQTASINHIPVLALAIRGAMEGTHYRLAYDIADSLATFADGLKTFSNVTLGILKGHIDALHSIIHLDIIDDGGAIGQELLQELQALSMDYKH